MKRFSDVNTKIKIELEDRNGNVAQYELRHIGPKAMKGLQKRAKEVKEDGEMAIDVGLEQMVMFFGGKPDDYEKYSVTTIMAVIKYIWDEINGGKQAPEQEIK
jgi:hypothetical protein